MKKSSLILSKRQGQVLNYIKETLHQRGYPPSVREIGEAIGLSSSSTVHSHLSKLEELGFIRRDPAKPRAIEVLDTEEIHTTPMLPVPLVGKITAGEPILAVENIEDYFPFPADMVQSDDAFMLSVRGSSMIEAGILDSDFILVRSQNSATNGDIVVALLGEDTTVKRFYKEKDYVRLQPANAAMKPILTREVTILGKVIGVFRIVR